MQKRTAEARPCRRSLLWQVEKWPGYAKGFTSLPSSMLRRLQKLVL